MSVSADKWIDMAKEAGFSQASVLDGQTLTPLDAVRDMCAADKCGLYGHCWTCPPGCGSIAENTAALRRFTTGLLVQTTRTLEDDFDYEGMTACGEAHRVAFEALKERLLPLYPGMLALGAGGCRLCKKCTYPGAPCRMPERANSSMEAYGLLVSDVCAQNGLGYYYGPGTITYTGCYMLR